MTPAMRAGLVAAAMSGVPSTFYALATGRPVLEATEAAGSILLPGEDRASRLTPAAGVIHVALSLFWSHVLARTLPTGRPLLWGSVAGTTIATVDLLIVGRRWEKIRALPLVPQFADHVAFGVVVACALEAARFDEMEAVRRHARSLGVRHG